MYDTNIYWILGNIQLGRFVRQATTPNGFTEACYGLLVGVTLRQFHMVIKNHLFTTTMAHSGFSSADQRWALIKKGT